MLSFDDWDVDEDTDAERMADAMVSHMADLGSAQIRGATRDRPEYSPSKPIALPTWLGDLA